MLMTGVRLTSVDTEGLFCPQNGYSSGRANFHRRLNPTETKVCCKRVGAVYVANHFSTSSEVISLRKFSCECTFSP